MKYVLAVLTHGDNAEMLDGLMHSFAAHVSPAPAACLVVQDGPCALPPFSSLNWTCVTLEEQQGFCHATNSMWAAATELANSNDANYVFWLEHDFRFRRAVDVRAMRTVLNSSETIAQVSLMRQSCNTVETEAGGVVQATRERGYLFAPRCNLNVKWLQHSAYWTTNPSLMRVEFMNRNPWPTEPQCEGRFGIDLISRGYNFAILGDGTPWIEHIGVRTTGKGY